MVICCVDLRYGRNQRARLIIIPCAYYIDFESTFPCHFMSMKACNSHFIREVTGTILYISKPVSMQGKPYRAISTAAYYE